MRLIIISRENLPLAAIILALAVVAIAFYNYYLQRNPAERALQRSIAELQAVLDNSPGLLNQRNKKTGYTLLHLAVLNKQTNVVNLLLERGANPNVPDRNGQTPLHKAAAFNLLEIAATLLEHGADPLAHGLRYGQISLAPIHLAAEANFAEMVQLFLRHHVDINLKTAGANHVTCLHMAAAKGAADVVELLLKSGAEVNPRDIQGRTPLYWAEQAGQEEIVNMLKIYDATQ